jgi:hypothetical protein
MSRPLFNYQDGRAGRPGALALTLGLLLAPCAWFMQTNLAQTIAAWACFPHDRPVGHPALSWLGAGQWTLVICALLVGACGAAISWRNWRRTDALAAELKDKATIDRHIARDVFIARAGTLASTLFIFALIATDLSWWIMSPCGGR